MVAAIGPGAKAGPPLALRRGSPGRYCAAAARGLSLSGKQDEDRTPVAENRAVGPRIPAVLEFTANQLRWSMRTERRPWTPAPGAPSRLLDRFLAIETASDVEGFVKQYGIVDLCADHGLPSGHAPPLRTNGTVEFCGAASAGRNMRSVPLDAIVSFAEQARAILRIADEVRRDRIPTQEDWALLGDYSFVYDTPGDSHSSARIRFETVVDNWLRAAGARIRFAWEPEIGPLLHIGDGQTTVAIAMEVAHAVLGGVYATCSGCASVYRRKERRASATQMNFCEDCRTNGTAERLRKARQRERARSTAETSEQA